MTTTAHVARPAINVCIMQPPGYIHALALLEAAEYVVEKCRLAGYAAGLSKNRLHADDLNIVFGAHIKPEDSLDFPPNTVIFNSEQIPEKSAWISSRYKACLDRHYVWDYSPLNLNVLGHDRSQRIDFFHVDSLSRLPPAQSPRYDLVFYGSINDRRRRIIENLRSRGLKILTVFGLYAAERDALLGQARAVLNLHFYDAQIFQQIRAFYALSNGMPVISENYPAASAPPVYGDVVFTPGSQRFEDYVATLLAQPDAFRAESGNRISRFQATRDNGAFALALETTLAAVLGTGTTGSAARRPVPARINLGSGKDYRPGYLNIDVLAQARPDLLLDLSQPTSFPATFPSPTYGEVTLAENSFDDIIAIDVLAHVHQLPQLMTHCLQLLKEGGRFTILVPYDLSLGAWQDPTHVRAFNENSWLYYTDGFWSLGWFQHRFVCTESSLTLSAFGKTLAAENIPMEQVMRTPRAIESMRVVLTKRLTTPEERVLARSYNSELKSD